MYSDALTTYQEAAIFSADPKELTRMLYEAAIDAVRQARDCFDSGDILQRGRKVAKAINIIDELAVSLDFDASPEISRKLVTLYAYLRRQLTQAHATRTRAEYNEAEQILGTMLEGWRGVCSKLGRSTENEVEDQEAFSHELAGLAFHLESAGQATRSWSL
ncbi:MAG: flagellar export chaperone FliS [Acidobacteria bacterium]|nr:flagellar export chaperone FliS [Acidobacteriota bacterium]